MDELIPVEENIVLRKVDSTRIDNGDGTFTEIISNGLNYLSNGEWKDMQYYYLEQIGQNAWSNMSDEFPCSIIGGEVITEKHRWKVDGIYIGNNKIWTPDFSQYTKYGDTIEFEMPFGILQYIIRPHSYQEQFIFNRNPFNGLHFDADELTIRYIGETDDNVWAKDAKGRDFEVKKAQFTKSVKTIDFYTAKYPFIIDPASPATYGASSDATFNKDNLTVNNYWLLVEPSVVLSAGRAQGSNAKTSWDYTIRSIVSFNISELASSTITAATLRLVNLGNVPFGFVLKGTDITDPEITAVQTGFDAVGNGTQLGTMATTGASLEVLTVYPNASFLTYIGGKRAGYASFGIMSNNETSVGSGSIASSEYATYPGNNPSLTLTFSAGVTYTVSFDSNGGSAVSSLTGIAAGSFILAPSPNPTKTGYNFIGWYEDNNTFLNPWVFASEAVNSDKILYAKWAAITSLAMWKNNGGVNVAPPSTQQTYGNATILPTTNPSRVGYSLLGFYDASSGGNKYTDTQFSVKTWDKVIDTDMFAQWSINSYLLTYNTNGGPAITGGNIVYNSLITQPPTQTRDGYVFDGWYTDNGTFQNQWNFSTNTMPANNLTLYEKWIQQLTITFDANGGGWS